MDVAVKPASKGKPEAKVPPVIKKIARVRDLEDIIHGPTPLS